MTRKEILSNAIDLLEEYQQYYCESDSELYLQLTNTIKMLYKELVKQ